MKRHSLRWCSSDHLANVSGLICLCSSGERWWFALLGQTLSLVLLVLFAVFSIFFAVALSDWCFCVVVYN